MAALRALDSFRLQTEQISLGVQPTVVRRQPQRIHFAAFKKHIGVFPPIAAEDAVLDAELLPYRGEKGNLRFPLNQPIPYHLIGRIAERLSVQYNTYNYRAAGVDATNHPAGYFAAGGDVGVGPLGCVSKRGTMPPGSRRRLPVVRPRRATMS